jgi:hypothetical protein
MFQASVPKYDEAWMLSDRLFPDRFALARQIRQVSDLGGNIPGRLAGGELRTFPTTDDTSFAEAKARVEKSHSGRCNSRTVRICFISDCPISTSTQPWHTTFCVIVVWSLASATSLGLSDRRRHVRASGRSGALDHPGVPPMVSLGAR